MSGALILIIEDNEKNLKLVRDVPRFNGYQTVEAMTAEEGIKIARLQLPSLILMDIQLPGMDGIAALRHLRADQLTKDIPVMAVTASATTLDREQIIEAGFNGYETKPLKIREFTEHVRSLLPVNT